MSIEETSVEARQGGRGFDILVVLAVSTVLAALALWGLFSIWAADNANVNDTSVSPGEAAITDTAPEEVVGDGVIQQDEPNPAVEEPLP